jgi:hypothetical protein
MYSKVSAFNQSEKVMSPEDPCGSSETLTHQVGSQLESNVGSCHFDIGV